eukprot:TRINITY_DN105282_c0_g1_i1.p1 TRINITY_DN105282_c0_g1~~TRINITY_DN105282_c0_g1_i1.p1  ORF type:complete len:431 (-),score=55.08 TRINITY_DN105282_c0_g1_i1:30-1322(-)
MADKGERTAQVCMVIIGIGYLFPIAAIWAAFDYWQVLFPGSGIEFTVTSLYQVGSVFTVAGLSLTSSFSLRRRILGGFAGQFVCLAVILSFRWLPVTRDRLFNLLLGVVFLCSVATGYLDSALFSLCSQYSARMQQYLQIGIGFGTLVSVIYRDLTKLLLSHDIADATCAYFVVALVTVLICVASYRILMTLPVSTALLLTEQDETLGANLVDKSGEGPINSPLNACGLLSPGGVLSRQSSKVSSPGEQHLALATAEADASFGAVIRQVWRNQLVILLNFFLTTLCYPGLITAIPCRQMLWLKAGHWFQTLLLTVFTVIDIAGRFATNINFGLHHGNIQWTVVVRSLLFPLILFCASSDLATDLMSALVVACFGFLNGLCASLSLIVINDIPSLSNEQRKTCGRISAFSVNSGLALGSLAASALAASMGL